MRCNLWLFGGVRCNLWLFGGVCAIAMRVRLAACAVHVRSTWGEAHANSLMLSSMKKVWMTGPGS